MGRKRSIWRHRDGRLKPPTYAAIAVSALVVAVAAVTAAITLSPRTTPAPAAEYTPQTEYSFSQVDAAQTRVAFLGDSYTVGARAEPRDRWTTRAALAQGWIELNHGVSDTGFTVVGAQPGGNLFRDRIPAIAEAAPDIVIVSGGRNDRGSTPDEMTAAVDATFADLRAALPNAQIVAVSPFWGDTAIPESLLRVADAVRASVEAVGGTYLEIGQPIAGRPDWMHEDGIHPVAPGYHAIADAFLAAWSEQPAG